MRNIFVLFFLIITKFGISNMSSPYNDGTCSSTLITSRNINIANEEICIKLNGDIETADFKINYLIKTDVDGRQIPLLFYAKDYLNNFKIWLDGNPIDLVEIPFGYRKITNNWLGDFSGSFNKDSSNVKIYWDDENYSSCKLSELKYFETNLSAGTHTISVEYTSKAWQDNSSWVRKYSFKYSLSPARFWKSFGNLQVLLDASEIPYLITTNLGMPTYGKFKKIASWHFNHIPADYININITPKANLVSRILIFLKPIGMTLILSVLILCFHLKLIIRNIKSGNNEKFSFISNLLFHFLIPLIILIFYILSFGIIDLTLGKIAGNHHGYTFLVIFLYPILLFAYAIIIKLFEIFIKNKLINAL